MRKFNDFFFRLQWGQNLPQAIASKLGNQYARVDPRQTYLASDNFRTLLLKMVYISGIATILWLRVEIRYSAALSFIGIESIMITIIKNIVFHLRNIPNAESRDFWLSNNVHSNPTLDGRIPESAAGEQNVGRTATKITRLVFCNPAFWTLESMFLLNPLRSIVATRNTCELWHRLLKFKQMPVRIPYD